MLDGYSKAVLTVIAVALSAIAVGLLGIVYATPPPDRVALPLPQGEPVAPVPGRYLYEAALPSPGEPVAPGTYLYDPATGTLIPVVEPDPAATVNASHGSYRREIDPVTGQEWIVFADGTRIREVTEISVPGPGGIMVNFPAGTDDWIIDRIMRAVTEFYVPPPPPGFVINAPGTPAAAPWENDPIVRPAPAP
jgi:hypothetical protein